MAYKRSVFPENGYDIFKESYDLPASLRPQALEYQTLKTKEILTPDEVSRLNILTTTLENYIITPEKMNYFQDAVSGTQKFFMENTVGFVNNKQIEMNTYTDEKKVEFQKEIDKFDDKGIYNPTITYVSKNFCMYDGQTYISLQTNTGVTPADDGIRWRKLTIQGERGLSGIGLVWRGQFVYSTVYQLNDLVRYENGLYTCKKITNGSQYPTDSTYWEIFLIISGNKVFKNQSTIQNPQTKIPIGISEFNNTFDELFVIQNSISIFEDIDYTVDVQTNEIVNKDGIWNSGTNFYFRVIQNGKNI